MVLHQTPHEWLCPYKIRIQTDPICRQLIDSSYHSFQRIHWVFSSTPSLHSTQRESTEASSGSLCKPSALVLPVKTGDGAQERTLLSWYPASFENFPRSSKILDGSLAYACFSGCFNATEPYLEEVFPSRSLSPNGGTSVGLWWASSCSACTSTQGTKITLQHSHGKGDSSPGRMHPYLPT